MLTSPGAAALFLFATHSTTLAIAFRELSMPQTELHDLAIKLAVLEESMKTTQAKYQSDIALLAQQVADYAAQIAEQSARTAEKNAEHIARMAERDAEHNAQMAERDAKQSARMTELNARMAEQSTRMAEQSARMAEKNAEQNARMAREQKAHTMWLAGIIIGAVLLVIAVFKL